MVDKYMEGKWHVKTLLPMPCIVLSIIHCECCIPEAGEYMQPVYACRIGIRATRSWYLGTVMYWLRGDQLVYSQWWNAYMHAPSHKYVRITTNYT